MSKLEYGGFNSQREFDRWASEREAKLFETERFKELGKEDDYIFQILSFMGKASQKMSIAFTLTDLLDNFPKELESEFREISEKYHELQEKVRQLKE